MGVRVSIAAPARAVPGEVAACDLEVENTSATAATFTLAVTGPAGAWARATPASLDLRAGETARARIVLTLPRTPDVAAGPHPLVVRVVPTLEPSAAVEAATSVDVAPLVSVHATVEPRTAAGRGETRFRVTMENRGNAPAAVVVDAVDPDDALDLDVEPAVVELALRGTSTASVVARPRTRFPFGESRPRPFRVVVSANGARPVQLEAVVEQQPSVPRSAMAAAMVLLAVAVALSLVGGGWSWAPARDPGGPVAAPLEEDRPDPACIGRGHLASDSDMPVSWSFLALAADGCTPVRFDPCQPLHYVTNSARAGPADRADLTEALRRLAEATGMEFVHDGETDEPPRLPPDPVVADRYGSRWAPVLIAWVGQETIAEARGGMSPDPPGSPTTAVPDIAASGVAVPDIAVPGAGLPVQVRGVYVSGVLLLNVDAVADLRTGARIPHGFGRGVNWGRVLLHELGHLLGLGHVRSTANLMHHQLGAHTSPSATFGVGDRVGLQAVGRAAGCNQTPVPPSVPARS